MKERGLVSAVAGSESALSGLLSSKKITAYAGFDPSAASLHIGNLLPLMSLLHLYLNGHRILALVGDATVFIGDPSGRTTERAKQDSSKLQASGKSIRSQIETFLETASAYATAKGYNVEERGKKELITNWSWLGEISLVDFLANVGRHVRVGQMLARDSVKGRMESGAGINYSEFSYQILQSYDFYHLYKKESCILQVGGNDQFGNITAGIDLIGRLTDAPPANENIAYGITVPLLTTASGEKLGKSMGNSVNLNGSPFELYQFFAKAEDASAETYLRVLTLLPVEEIKSVMERHNERPEDRLAQKTLAREVVHMLHGEEAAKKAEAQSAVLFGKGEDSVSSADAILQGFEKGDVVQMKRGTVVGELLAKVMKTAAGMSRGQANQVLKAGGVYVGPGGKHRVTEELAQVDPSWLVEDRVLLLRIGKRRLVAVEVVA
ncbi:hypothetical protein BJ508DRAFT_410914 [Ascobolus immersus RN42]|uniref:Tyrosine--tRNA ligase n=1 Tax=Ascobolus immersus RN42 TaxID=1160509 RepID=A0A3N4IR61_ASCIM|nr:hypothetical protein BJ508DRAFT_410914 [Ascobolus immersus RN42]